MRPVRAPRGVYGTLIACLIGFALLTAVVAIDPAWLASTDRTIGAPALDLTSSHRVLEAFWSADAVLEQPNAFRLLLVLLAAGFAIGRRWSTASWLGAAVALSSFAAPYTKLIVRRPRPTWADPIRTLSDYSYPSGHATAAWTAVAAVVLLASFHLQRRWHRLTVIVLAVGSALVVSADRIFLGVHHPSDVLAGALLGTALATGPWTLAWLLAERARTRAAHREMPQRTYRQAQTAAHVARSGRSASNTFRST